MALSYPHFLINFKIYDGTSGGGELELARTIETVGEQAGVSFAVAPQTPDIARVAERTSLDAVAQAIDAVGTGRGNGSISLQAIAEAGADGVLINHPESKATLSNIEEIVTGCAEFGLESIVCVDSVGVGRAALAFDPDCLLLETPADIETEQSIAEADPERVETFVSMVEEVNPRTRVLLGGGISTGDDVEAAFSLGVDAAGAASAFIDATDRQAWLSDVATALPKN